MILPFQDNFIHYWSDFLTRPNNIEKDKKKIILFLHLREEYDGFDQICEIIQKIKL